MRARLVVTFALLSLLCAGCGADDVVRIRIDMKADRSATLHVSSLLMQEGPGPMEAGAKGVTWNERAVLQTSAGTVADLDGMTLDDVTFRTGTTDTGLGFVSVTLPRGDSAKWFRKLAPSREDRTRVQKTFDPTETFGKVGYAVKFELLLPGVVGGNGVHPRGRGVVVDAEKHKAILLVPIDAMIVDDGVMTWDVTWR
jgi:hypothetical protein